MRVRVRRSFRVALGARARANAKGTTVVPGGIGGVALGLLALGLAACSSGGPATTPPATTPPATTVPATTPPATSPPGARLWSTTGNTNLGPFNYPLVTASSVFNGGNTWVRPNEWNIGYLPSTQQATYAYNPGHWWVVANLPSGNTAVVTGPDTQQDMYNRHQVDPAVSGFTEIKSTYSVTMPQSSAVDAEANYDMWLNHWSTEVMIWTDTEKQRPAGHEVGTHTIGGATYNFWSKSAIKRGYPRGPFSFVLAQNQPSGSVNILAVLQWLINNNYIPASSRLTDVEFGFELCSTGGVPQTFHVNNYTLTTAPNPSV